MPVYHNSTKTEVQAPLVLFDACNFLITGLEKAVEWECGSAECSRH